MQFIIIKKSLKLDGSHICSEGDSLCSMWRAVAQVNISLLGLLLIKMASFQLKQANAKQKS